MARKILTALDLSKNEIQNAVVQVLASDPSTPATGQIYYNSTDSRLKQYTGSAWIEYSTLTSAGDASTNTATSVDSEVALFSGTTGKLLKRATISGLAKLASGVLSAATAGTDYYNPGGTDVAITDGGTGVSTLPTGALKGNGTGAITQATINDLAAQTADYAANSHKITGLTDPTSAQDAATKNYVDATSQGLNIKPSARFATTGAETFTISSGNVTQITGTSVDGGSPSVNDRILIKDAPASTGAGSANSTQPGNGVYTVTNATTNLTVSRVTDLSGSNNPAGAFVFVEAGTANASAGYVVSTPSSAAAFTYGTGNIHWTQFSGAGEVTAGTGLSKSANTLSIDTTVTVDKTTAQVLTNKDVSSGTNTFPIFNQNTTGSAAKLTTARNINGVAFDGTAAITVPGNSTTATYGDGTTLAYAITHGLASTWPLVQLFEVSTGNKVEADIQRTSSTVVTITHVVAPTTNQYRYIMFG